MKRVYLALLFCLPALSLGCGGADPSALDSAYADQTELAETPAADEPPMSIVAGSTSQLLANTPLATIRVPVLPSPTPTVTLTSVLSASAGARLLNPNIAALSYEKHYVNNALFDANNANMVALFRLMGPGTIRFGGNSVDQAVWDPTAAGGGRGVSPPDVVKLAAFLKKVNWKAIYGLRMVGNTPASAADEAAYVAKALGTNLYGFEVGNEPDFYAKNTKVNDTKYDITAFLTGGGTLAGWNDYVTAIRSKVPGAVLTGPGAYNAPSGWAMAFGKAKNKPTYHELTQHYYKGWGPDKTSTAASLLVPDSALPTTISTLRSAAAAPKDANGRIRFTECNSFAGGGAAGASNSYASALWASNFLYVSGINGIRGAHMHGGGKDPGYTPIADDRAGSVVEVRPIFYGMLAFRRTAQGQSLSAVNSPSRGSFIVRSTQAADKSVRVLLLNTDVKETVQTTLQWPANMTAKSGLAMYLANTTAGGTAAQLASTGNVTLGGASIGSDGTWNPTEVYSVLNVNGKSKLTLPPLTGLIVQMP